MTSDGQIHAVVPFDPMSYAVASQYLARGLRVKFLTIWLPFMAAIAAYSAYVGCLDAVWWCAAGVVFVLALVTVTSSRRFLARKVRQVTAHLPDSERKAEWDISAELVEQRSWFGRIGVEWRALNRIVRLREGFVLILYNSTVYWLPCSAFSSPEDIESFAALARKGCAGYKDQSGARFPFWR